jgi:hypothetical protein
MGRGGHLPPISDTVMISYVDCLRVDELRVKKETKTLIVVPYMTNQHKILEEEDHCQIALT